MITVQTTDRSSSDHLHSPVFYLCIYMFSKPHILQRRTLEFHTRKAFKMSENPGRSSFHGGLGIEEFLVGKSIFITGATGFLAKVLIEKLLRTVPEVGKMFLLIRAKTKEDAMARLENEIINAELFKCLRETYGESYEAFMLSKLVPVMGDVCRTNLGLEDDFAIAIANEVHIIINSAANTNFHARYDDAIDINTRGACHVVCLAKKCKRLKVFLHVSTVYVNGMRQGRIKEKPFRMGDSIARELINFNNLSEIEPELHVENEIELANRSKQLLDNAPKKMEEFGLERAKIYGWQDTYVFTKAMGEMIIDNIIENIPVVIIRPSIIESTLKEPFPGWIEGNRMMDPIVLHYGKGQLNNFLADPNGVLDVVPADMVVNAMVAAITKHGAAQGSAGIKVYQVASSITNPLVFKHLVSFLHEHFEASPCLDSKGRPIRVPLMKLFTSMEDFSADLLKDARQQQHHRRALHHLPQNNKGLYTTKFAQRVEHLANLYGPYLFYGGRFDSSNTVGLMESMNEEEKRRFGFDVKSIDWRDYIINVHITGLRRHVCTSLA